jgi:uncharacterized protein YxeA
MKSILETSIYLVVMTLICLIGIDFVIMNKQVTKANELVQYAKDYIEIYGQDVRAADGSTAIKMDEHTLQVLSEKAQSNHMMFSYVYEGQTDCYVYWKINMEYQMETLLFHMTKNHAYSCFVRSSIDT